jgi:SAM-dependent methyltransferase
LGKYYPNEDYYSFNLKLEIKEKPDVLRKLKTDYLLFGKQPILGGLLSIGYKMNELYDWVKYTKAQYNDAILDVGTGNGSLLAKLFNIGFTNLTGIDPFINESKDYGSIKILKQDIIEVEKQYDVVMMHHSLEHMFEPLKALQQVYKITKPGGRALVRVPIMGNYGWKTYGEFWCGVDAPRHIFIPSENGLKQLVTEAGFTIEKFYYDSFDYVIWASEQYKKGMALHDPKSHLINEKESMFTREQLKAFRKKMIGENAKDNGDMAAIYLYKPL